MIGLIMIKVAPAKERSVYMDLQSRPEIIRSYRLFGEFSFLLVMQARDRSHLDRLLEEIKVANHVLITGPLLVSLDQDPRMEVGSLGLCRACQS
jgi:muconolactone delta-isomerase